jgi:hypothetical protein
MDLLATRYIESTRSDTVAIITATTLVKAPEPHSELIGAVTV